MTASVRPTNVASKRAFAQLDRLSQEKPNASAMAMEGIVLFAGNKTAEWLQNQSEARQHQLFESALNGAQQHRRLFRERCQAIADFHRTQIVEKERQRVAKEAVTIQTKQQLTEAISQTGLWTVPGTVVEKLALLPTASSNTSALKTQIKFR